jgi:lipopolysaccharide biosynthesis protein
LSPLEVYHQFGRYQGFVYPSHNNDPVRELPAPKWANVEFPAALVVHAFYLEEFNDIAARLSSSAHEIDIVVTTPHPPASIEGVLRTHRLAAKEVLQFPNHGRDVFPFVHLLNSGLLTQYTLIGKLHTKRSTHRGDGSSWLDDCLKCLLRIKEVNALMQDKTIGMIAPAGRVGGKDYLEASWWKLLGLSARAGWSLSRDEVRFPVGTMFWARAEALAAIARLGLTQSDFEAEAGQLDGTMAHAIERLFGVACSKSGYRLVEM